VDRDYLWHMTTIERLAQRDAGLVRPTRYLVVDLNDPESQAAVLGGGRS
jgi:PNKP adenylyltransferase domain, ligase domain